MIIMFKKRIKSFGQVFLFTIYQCTDAMNHRLINNNRQNFKYLLFKIKGVFVHKSSQAEAQKSYAHAALNDEIESENARKRKNETSMKS